jgi:hypothetical protein
MSKEEMVKYAPTLPRWVDLPGGTSVAETSSYPQPLGVYAPVYAQFKIDTNDTDYSGRNLEKIYVTDTAHGGAGKFPDHNCLVTGTETSPNVWVYELPLNVNSSAGENYVCQFTWRPWDALVEDGVNWFYTQKLFTSGKFPSSPAPADQILDIAYSFYSEESNLTGFHIENLIPSTYMQVTTAIATAVSAWYENSPVEQRYLEYDNLTNIWARGDWSGSRFFSKYGLLSGILSGVSDTFSINDYEEYRMRRTNESWDTTQNMKSYTTQEFQENESFFGDYVEGLVGGVENGTDGVGRKLYERIANQTKNIHDVDECVVESLYSLAKETDVPIDDYLLAYPEAVRRIMDIASVSHMKLWGDRCTCHENFLRGKAAGYCAKCNHYHETNLGSAIAADYTVSAGSPYIIENKFRPRDYKIIYPSQRSCSAAGGMLSGDIMTADLGSHTSLFVNGQNGDSEWLNYCYYNYIPTQCNTQNTGVIDWDDPNTTLDESVSGTSAWYGDEGVVEKLFGYLLRNGYGFGLSGYQV